MHGLPVPPKGGPPARGSGGETRGPDQRLAKNQRLIRSALFDEAFAQQRKIVGKTMVLWRREGEGAALRLGVVTSRKVGGAVQRARARRLLRDVFRRNRHRLSGSYDVVLVARASILRAGSAAIEADFMVTVTQAGLVSQT